ncbi:MAG: damage-control phosphatase ARMT1 family protein [Candidatus Methylomirabilales bacterium]
MSAFTLPPSQVDLTDLPPAIQTSEPGSFARYTLEERVPAILQETIALNRFPDDIRGALHELHAELTGGVIRELREDASDRAFWNVASAPYIGRNWLDVPWYWAEAYFYRRLLEATRYFQPGPWQGVDPFGPKKATELVPEAAPHSATTLLRGLPDDPAARFEILLHASLWGNRMDLSYEIASRLGRPTGARDERGNLLVDDTARLWDFLRSGGRRRLAILTDNAGTELLMDLALVDYLLGQDLAVEVHVHLKPQPFFVSDAMPQDVMAGLDALEREGDVAWSLSQRLRMHIASRRLHLFDHWHYATSLFFFQLPEDLHTVLAGMDLVLVKGDANYRRLLGDAHWPPTTPFASATSYFHAPIVALRTLKAEIIVGLRPGEAERLQAEDPAWLVNGQRGIVQARL